MNPFIIEPHDPWKKPRKKHWMEIAEEEALMHRIIQEQQATSQQTQDASTEATAAGAGGVPPLSYFQSSSPVVSVAFAYEPTSAIVTWTDTNGAGQSGDLATFNATADLPTVTAIDLHYQGLTSLTMGNQLPALTSLNISYNVGLATDFDATGLTSLTYLNCGYCALTSLTVAGMSNLESLITFYNAFTSLDLTGLTSLTTLDIGSSQLTTIDLTPVPNLTYLTCYYSANLTGLDLSKVPNLTTLIVSFTSFSSPPDYTQVPLLEYLGVSGIGYLPDLTLFPNLTSLLTANNSLTSLDVSMLPSLVYLDCNFNSITSLDVSGMTTLQTLYCANNGMTTLNMTGCSGLVTMSGGGNSIGVVDIDSSSLLAEFSINGNGMNTANVDYILSTINGFGTSGPGRYIGLSGNSAPTGGFSNADKLALESRNWLIYL